MLLVAGETEEIIFFFDHLRRSLVDWAETVHQFIFVVKQFTADAVETLVAFLVDVAIGGTGAPITNLLSK